MTRRTPPRRGCSAATLMQWQKTNERLDEMAALSENWNSYGGHPPTPGALACARALLNAIQLLPGALQASLSHPYAMAPLPHGGVYFEWRGPQRALEVHIDPEGRLGYLAVMQVGGDETFAEADAVSTETILNLLARTLSPESMA